MEKIVRYFELAIRFIEFASLATGIVMTLYKKFGTNKKHEIEGVWIDFGEFRIKIKRAGQGNPEYLKSLDKVMKQHRVAIKADALSPEKQRDIMYHVYADSVILDWQGVKGKNDEDIPYSKENVVQVFRDLPDFFEIIKGEAENISNFQDAEKEIDTKN